MKLEGKDTYLCQVAVECFVYHTICSFAKFFNELKSWITLLLLLIDNFIFILFFRTLQILINMAVRMLLIVVFVQMGANFLNLQITVVNKVRSYVGRGHGCFFSLKVNHCGTNYNSNNG